jgi:hypothetical protein
MTPRLDCTVASRASWFVAGIQFVCVVRHHQAAGRCTIGNE